MPYGIEQPEWDAAVQAITDILSHRAGTMPGDELISYSQLFNEIRHLVHSVRLVGPEDHRFHHMLGAVSTNEHNAGRALLSVLVVYKSGETKPGPGFFELARHLGYEFIEEEKFWIDQFNKVCEVWRGPYIH